MDECPRPSAHSAVAAHSAAAFCTLGLLHTRLRTPARPQHSLQLFPVPFYPPLQAQGPPGPGQQQVDVNVWAYKPVWCQPWSILGTGAAIVGGVNLVSGGSTGWTVFAAVPILAWFWLFLGVMPAQFREQAEAYNAQLRQEQQARQQAEQRRQGGDS